MLVAARPRPFLSFAIFFFDTPSSFCRRLVAARFSWDEMPPEPPPDGAARCVATVVVVSPPPPQPTGPRATATTMTAAAPDRASARAIGRSLGRPLVLLEVHELPANVARRLVLHPPPALAGGHPAELRRPGRAREHVGRGVLLVPRPGDVG